MEVLIRHIEGLAKLRFAKDCHLGILIEGQTKSVAQTLHSAIDFYFRRFFPIGRDPLPFRPINGTPFFFVNAYNMPNKPDNEYYYPNNESRIRGMLAIQKAIETCSLLRHKDMFFEGTERTAQEMWMTLGRQLRNIRMLPPKNKISGKNNDKEMGRDDLHMALSNFMEALKVVPGWFVSSRMGKLREYAEI